MFGLRFPVGSSIENAVRLLIGVEEERIGEASDWRGAAVSGFDGDTLDLVVAASVWIQLDLDAWPACRGHPPVLDWNAFA